MTHLVQNYYNCDSWFVLIDTSIMDFLGSTAVINLVLNIKWCRCLILLYLFLFFFKMSNSNIRFLCHRCLHDTQASYIVHVSFDTILASALLVFITLELIKWLVSGECVVTVIKGRPCSHYFSYCRQQCVAFQSTLICSPAGHVRRGLAPSSPPADSWW